MINSNISLSQRKQSQIEPQNINMMFEKNIFEEFPNKNSEHRDKIKDKIGRNLK